MQCPQCQQSNPHTNNFCQSCGANLRQAPPRPVRQVRRVQAPVPHQAPPAHHAPVPHQAQPWSQHPPAGQAFAARVKAQPVYLLLLAAAAICLVGLFFQWEPDSAYGRATYTTRGFEYSDGTRSTWTRPEAVVTYNSGGNGLEPVKLTVLALLAGSALVFSQRPWPRWARYTLVGLVLFMAAISVGNLLFYPSMGIMLFTAGTGLAGWATYRILRSRS